VAAEYTGATPAFMKLDEDSSGLVEFVDYQIFADCKQGKACSQLVEHLSAIDRSRADQWLDYCWTNGIISYA